LWVSASQEGLGKLPAIVVSNIARSSKSGFDRPILTEDAAYT
jgi:hypothetical protein